MLYVALARAIGLPARTDAGLVYLRGHFYYHAWPEVWLGQWVAVDPTFGQFPADASHLRFVIGGLARQVLEGREVGREQLAALHQALLDDLELGDPDAAKRLLKLAEEDVHNRWRDYQNLAAMPMNGAAKETK